MEIFDLKLFREIARHGSITLAAQALGLSQPTASRRLQRIEQELGAELLHRSSVPLEITASGTAVLDFAETTLRQFDNLLQQLGQTASVSGQLSVATSTTPAARLVTDCVTEFVASQPKVRVNIDQMSSRDVQTALIEGRASVGFMGIAPHHKGLTSMVVSDDEIVLIVPTHGEFRRLDEAVDPAQLFDLPFIGREPGSGTAEIVVQTLKAHGYSVSFRTVMRVSTGQALVSAVEAGAGAGFVSRQFLLGRNLRGVRIIRLHNLSVIRPLFMVYSDKDAEDHPTLKAFLRFARQRFQSDSSD